MEKNKIIENGFSWTTPSKLPGSGPIVEEPTPWLWLCRQGSDCSGQEELATGL